MCVGGGLYLWVYMCAHVSECMFVVLQSLFTCWPGWVKWMIVWRDWEAGLVFPDTLLVQLVYYFFSFLLLNQSLFLTEEQRFSQHYS